LGEDYQTARQPSDASTLKL